MDVEIRQPSLVWPGEIVVDEAGERHTVKYVVCSRKKVCKLYFEDGSVQTTGPSDGVMVVTRTE